MESHAVRQTLIQALELDLVGPTTPDDEHVAERLPERPSRWYLTGFLVPTQAPEDQKADDSQDEQLDVVNEFPTGDDDQTPDKPSALKHYFPSSMGISVLLPAEAKQLEVQVNWGAYDAVERISSDENTAKQEQYEWHRRQCEETVHVPIEQNKVQRIGLAHHPGVQLVVTQRQVTTQDDVHQLLPHGTKSVSVFVVNQQPPADGIQADTAFLFQTKLILRCLEGFVTRPNPKGRLEDSEFDEQVADLQYRDLKEFGVGHGVATYADIDQQGLCQSIESKWIPTSKVYHVQPATSKQPNAMNMDLLGDESQSGAALVALLQPVVDNYRHWIQQHFNTQHLAPHHHATAQALKHRALMAAKRIEEGIHELDKDDDLRFAFQTANRVMARAARQRRPDSQPTWRLFQLAFILLNIQGTKSPDHPDRQLVDLIFFPTGGGKTEAYLGLSALTLVLRRLRHDGSVLACGVSVIMRYTLRLLTLDQLERATAMIISLEIERRTMQQQGMTRLGDWPFEIGLWVGSGATPNIMGDKKNKREYTALGKLEKFKTNPKRFPSPIPLKACPWCKEAFKGRNFKPYPDATKPIDLHITCLNKKCAASTRNGFDRLPVIAIDEPLYRRLPSFLIATVDKFANVPWVGRSGALFGRVQRHDQQGFYGPSDPRESQHQTLPAFLDPPDLIIQDELHLISGPVGTMVGLYEAILDTLSSREGSSIKPKIIASTATIRRAHQQIQALFARQHTAIFPPPGPQTHDNFFAQTIDGSDGGQARVQSAINKARWYVGVSAQGRSPKVILLRTALALMSSAQLAFDFIEDEQLHLSNQSNAADPYMTLLAYFNSLRELGGSRRIIEDEVHAKLPQYSKRQRLYADGEQTDDIFADRKIAFEPLELTSRVSSDKVSEAKTELTKVFGQDKNCVDVALASNMISVGLDIVRLGLMLVMGQPKSAAEYIQATSRVGRDIRSDEDDGEDLSRPGLVVTILNTHRPRDRSHYERFEAFHNALYRHVEATSVTPFASRALQRGLAGVTVALARHLHPDMTPARGAIHVTEHFEELQHLADLLADRADIAAPDMALDEDSRQVFREGLRAYVKNLLDTWANKVARIQKESGSGTLIYQQYEEYNTGPRLLFEPLDKGLKELEHKEEQNFKAQRSLRNIEPSVNVRIKTLNDVSREDF